MEGRSFGGIILLFVLLLHPSWVEMLLRGFRVGGRAKKSDGGGLKWECPRCGSRQRDLCAGV